ncbi:MAG TPA: UDP-3-O-(3-hydroxymyristoyl)glucosamine N-acyltransferase [Terriglobales bacterium]|nr:UDP-3-O-(3-hydroxymyristoyl)glucosamine N-acyltransferase [Terriglobales bacterium]
MKRSLKSVAEFIHAQLIGDGKTQVWGVASIKSAKPGDLVFVEEAKFLDAALSSGASAVIAGESATKVKSSKPLLIVPEPRLAFARAGALLCEPEAKKSAVHATAVVANSARLSKDVSIAAHAVVGEDVTIGEASSIGAGSVIGRRTVIGTHCNIAANVTVYPGVRLGNRVTVHAGAVLGSDGFGFVRDSKSGEYVKFPQIGGLEIGDDVEIGANTTIDRGALDVTVIARGAKLDNLVHVGHNVRVGENVVIAAQTGLSGSAVVEDGAIIGGQVGIADHVRIEKGAILGAQSGIPSRKVIRGAGVVFWGTPARPIRQYLKELAVLARLAKKDQTETE